MLGSYIKTSIRNIVRNKLFSGINIIGLAIGMSVGLLVITLVHDIFSYDRFNLKRDRIFRVTSTIQSGQQNPEKLASSSLKIGAICKYQISGIEEVTVIKTGFGGDVQLSEKTIPVTGLWADSSIFKVFTFPLLRGDFNTALKEPHSIVLTEKTANKLFGKSDALNQVIHLDSSEYKVTGIMKDIPFFSHLQFEALASFSTLQQQNQNNPDFLSWKNTSNNYVYLLLSPKTPVALVNSSLSKIDILENSAYKNFRITTSLIPLTSIFLGEDLHNEIGHSLPRSLLWVVISLAIIAILTACFNYTNLSIARSIRRSREVGVRKILGALKSQVMAQFIVESTILSLVSLVFAFAIFLLLRTAFLSLGPSFATLQLSPGVILSFFILASAVGILAGFLPAASISGINPLSVLKNAHSLKLFRHVNLRKALIFSQYSFSLFFMAVTIIIYKQYDYFTSQDLGFKTENIVNISLPTEEISLLKEAISKMPESKQISQSQMVNALGSGYSAFTKYDDPRDSVITDQNSVDENYLPLHQFKLLAGRNFLPSSDQASSNEVVVNEKLIKYFNLGKGNPEKAIGLNLTSNGKNYQIIGVVQDFHYNSLYSEIKPSLIKYAPTEANYLNINVNRGQEASFKSKVNKIWKSIDPVHTIVVVSYQDQIKDFYQPLSFISKIIGSLAFLTIFIASMGLFGMVVFTVETRIKEVSVRKVLGASEISIVYMLSKSFLGMLSLAAMLALIISSLLFNKLIATVAYHASIPLINMIGCTVVFMLVALLIICSQTLRAARSNPAHILKGE